ncbi:ABC transporter ATP-binding protein [Actinoplanes sp. URMC 104]|uniref:ABC transporter ATP-binding protein n=1 Tax=Actinoplanes sp. URMC 104 TaxID=3423409 RepID=UPI003F1B2207
MISVRDVSHRSFLHDVTLSLPAAELAVLAGRSGSGKSTLCHLIAGVMPPTSGEVLVADRPAYPAPDWATVSLLPQRLALEPDLTVAENVLLPATLRGATPALPDELLERLGLAAIAGRPARETSLGEQQRTALARALVLSPAVAVLDEPTAHQDDEHVGMVLEALTAVVRSGTLAVVATHDQRVIDVAGTVVRMRSGSVA